jgi:hypothetical protein
LGLRSTSFAPPSVQSLLEIDLQSAADAAKGADQAVQAAVGDELLSAAEVGDHALTDLAAFAPGLTDLDVLAVAPALDTSLEPHKHGKSLKIQYPTPMTPPTTVENRSEFSLTDPEAQAL